jgi:hypothetical protein
MGNSPETLALLGAGAVLLPLGLARFRGSARSQIVSALLTGPLRGVRPAARQGWVKALLMSLSLTACVSCSPVTGSDHLAKNDPGPYPTNYKQVVGNYLPASLKDPYSVQSLSASQPQKVTVDTGLAGGGNVQAWQSCVTYNAKNSYGAYTGIRYYTFTFRDGQLFSDATGMLRITEGC